MLWILLIEIFTYVVPVIDITLVLLFLSISLILFHETVSPSPLHLHK